MGDQFSVLSTREARHLLRRTGFGAPPDQVAAIAGRTRESVVSELLGFNTTKFKPSGKYVSTAHNKWIKYMLSRTDRRGIGARRIGLQEKLVLFWHDHFATSYDKVYNVKALAKQNQTLRTLCKGNFRELLKAVNRDPAMMDYLDTIRNTKFSPNENYARELQELFALGVKDFQGNETYSQDDIIQIARAFTGWRFDNKLIPYFDQGRHNTIADAGPKVIFTEHGNFGPSGVSFAEPEGPTEIDQVVDILLQHTDTDTPPRNTAARFITAKLFSFFAYADPEASVVDAIVSASSFDVSWDLSALLREIFVHDAFYETSAAPPFDASDRKSIRWPVDYVVSTMRLLHMRFRGGNAEIGTSGSRVQSQLGNMGQVPFFPPSVFGWDWETNWMTSFTMLSRFRFARDVVSQRNGTSKIYFQPGKVIDLAALNVPAENGGAIVDAVLEALGIIDQVDTPERDALIAYVTQPGAPTSHVDLTDSTVLNKKIRGLFYLALESPANHVF